MQPDIGLLAVAVGLIAALYASVGHAGATGYVAVMTLWGLDPAEVRPTALLLNVVVGAIASVQFWRAGYFSGRLFLPLCVGSVPAAILGGYASLPTAVFEVIVGGVLLASAFRIASTRAPTATEAEDRTHPLPVSLLGGLGVALGLLSGLTGVGGGVFLTPLLLAIDAAAVRKVAAVSAPFILVNSIGGLAGGFAAGRTIPPVGLPLLVAVAGGGLIGSQLGAFTLPPKAIRLLMAVVLVIAGLRLLLPRFS